MLLDALGRNRFLRVLEDRQIERLGSSKATRIDTRIIAATHRDLEKRIAADLFREDLYYRLNVFPIRVPPLRERTEDIPMLVWRFVEDFSAASGKRIESISKDNIAMLQRYHWPGNVRELRNLLESAALLAEGSIVTLRDFPEHYQEILLGIQTAPASDRDQLLSALVETKWNKTAAAQKLNCSRMTVYRKMAQYRLRETAERALAVGA